MFKRTRDHNVSLQQRLKMFCAFHGLYQCRQFNAAPVVALAGLLCAGASLPPIQLPSISPEKPAHAAINYTAIKAEKTSCPVSECECQLQYCGELEVCF